MDTTEDKKKDRINRGDMTTHSEFVFDDVAKADLIREMRMDFNNHKDLLSHKKEITIVDPESGGMKGQKLARYDMIPPDVLWELAEHYGLGEKKYPSDETGLANWRRGYDWRLSYAAAMRHIQQWMLGEEIDAESGSPHLIAAMWHLVALRYFKLHGKGKDFRHIGL